MVPVALAGVFGNEGEPIRLEKLIGMSKFVDCVSTQ